MKTIDDKLTPSNNCVATLSFAESSNGNFPKPDLADIEYHNYEENSSTNNLPNKYKHQTPVNSLAKEIYLYNGHLRSLSFSKPSVEMFSDYEKRMIVLSEASKDPTPEPSNGTSGRPSAEQLEHVFNVLSNNVSDKI